MKRLNIMFAALISLSLAFSTSAFADTPKKAQAKNTAHSAAHPAGQKNTKAKKPTAKNSDLKSHALKTGSVKSSAMKNSKTKNKTHTTQHAVNTKHQTKKKAHKGKSTHSV